MRLIYTDGFPVHERKEVRQVIFSNMVVAFKIIAEEMRDLGMDYVNKETEVRQSQLSWCSFYTNVGLEIRGSASYR